MFDFAVMFRLPKLFICEFCLKYLKNHCALELHMVGTKLGAL